MMLNLKREGTAGRRRRDIERGACRGVGAEKGEFMQGKGKKERKEGERKGRRGTNG